VSLTSFIAAPAGIARIQSRPCGLFAAGLLSETSLRGVRHPLPELQGAMMREVGQAPLQ
jgi:hypothetical protein